MRNVRRRDRSGWSVPLGRLFGVEIRVHATLSLLLVWLVSAHLLAGGGLLQLLQGLALVAALFGIVLLHELAHALTARRFGISTHDITLLPIGGMSRLARMPEKPGEELLIAVAGPAVNLVLALAILVLMAVLRLPPMPHGLVAIGSPLLAQLLWINLSLAIFNLLPAFPTDGGRALRAALAMRLPRARATVIAATIGRGMAVLFAAVGVFYNVILVAIAVFLYIGAQEEERWARLKSVLAGLPVARGMVTDFRSLRPRDPLSRAAALIVAGAPPSLPVTDEHGVVGVVTRTDVVRGLQRGKPDMPVADIMNTQMETMDAGAPLDYAVERARSGTAIIVERDRAVVGLLTPESVVDVALFATTLERGA